VEYAFGDSPAILIRVPVLQSTDGLGVYLLVAEQEK
jgi:hypothetical protein